LSLATTRTFGAPGGFRDEDDWQAWEWPDLPLWSENFFFSGWDAAEGLGVWLHLGRMPSDPTLWREMVLLYLPDGTIVGGKHYGRAESARGPGSGTLSFECLEPWNAWAVRFDGVLVRSSFDRLVCGLFTDGLHIPAAVDVQWRPFSPIWDMGAEMRRQSWGHIHYEQLGRLVGVVRVEDREVGFNGVGIRDHTRGPRDWTQLRRHCWLHGVFPGDRGFMVCDVEVEGHHLRRATVVADGLLHEAELVGSPCLQAREDGQHGYQIDLEGHPPIRAEILHNNAMGFADHNEVTFGFDPAVSSHTLFEGFTRFSWGDATGYGLTERTLRHR
jgi:hypothetical protein